MTMYVEIAITEEERKRIVAYAQAERIRMDRAYSELIRVGLDKISF